jgi:hypothetical protein
LHKTPFFEQNQGFDGRDEGFGGQDEGFGRASVNNA